MHSSPMHENCSSKKSKTVMISTCIRTWLDDQNCNHIEILEVDRKPIIEKTEFIDQETLIHVRCWGGFDLAREISSQCEKCAIQSKILDESPTRPCTPMNYNDLFADDCCENE